MLGKRFTDFFLELQRIKLEVEYSLESLQNKMTTSADKEAVEVVQNYYQRMESDEDTKAQLQIVDKLRMDIKTKSPANHIPHGPYSTRINQRSPHGTETLACSVEANTTFEEKVESDLSNFSLLPETIIKQEIEDFNEESPTGSPPPASPPDPYKFNLDSITKPKKNESKEIKLRFNFKCERCNKPFVKRVDLTRHMKNCKGTKTLTSRWNASFLKTRLKGSKCVYNPDTGRYKCSICSKELSATGCRYHYEAVHLQSKFECDLCHAVYNSGDRLKVHKRTCNGPKPRKLNENEFGHIKPKIKRVQNASKKPRTRGRKCRFNPETRKHQCQICSEEFSSRTVFNSHFDNVHLQKTFQCEKCHLIVKTRFVLRNHQKYHCKAISDKDKEVHICEICGKEYNNPVSLNSHKYSFHKGLKYFCKYCQKEFTNRANFHKHQKNQVCQKPDYYKYVRKPNDLKGHKCDICKVIAFESNTSEDFFRHREECLQKRMQMEQRLAEKVKVTGKGAEKVEEKKKRKPAPPSACPICGKWFARKTGVNYHLQQVHLNERKYICDVCGKSYKDNTQLKRHKSSVHLGEVLTCEDCKAEFKSWNSLKYHKKKCGGQDKALDRSGAQMENPGPSSTINSSFE